MTNTIENSQQSPSPEKSPETRESALERFFNRHLTGVKEKRATGDNDSAFTSFLTMIEHIKKWQLTPDEIHSSLADLCRDQALFHLEYARRLNGRGGQIKELERVKHCLNQGQLTPEDIGATTEEIEQLKPIQ